MKNSGKWVNNDENFYFSELWLNYIFLEIKQVQVFLETLHQPKKKKIKYCFLFRN